MSYKFTLIVLLTLSAITKPFITTAQVNMQDSLALVDLYNSTDGPKWTHHTNWLTTQPVVSWYGVSGYENNRVTSLQLGFIKQPAY